MPGRQIFEKYRKVLGEQYEKSDLVHHPENCNWFYSVCATPLFSKSVVLCGLNWGADDSHSPQTEYPSTKFMDIKDLGSLSRTKDYLKKYLTPAQQDEITQINLCFFRTKKESDLTGNDLTLNHPIFLNLIEDLQPKFLLAMSSRIAPVLGQHLAQIESKEIQNGRRTIEVQRGRLSSKLGSGEFAYVPHPNYPMRKEARDLAWGFAFGDSLKK